MKKIITILSITLFVSNQIFAQAGSLDVSFGTGGKVIHSIGQKDDWAWCALLQPDGKILAGGYSTVDFVQQQSVARFNTNGTPDMSFGTGGSFVSTTERAVFDMALQSDGKIVTCGFQYNSNFYSGFAASRLNSNGTLDNSFGTNGSVRHSFGTVIEQANTIAVQSDGKIVAAGRIETGNNNYDFAMLRMNPDGTLDPTFGDAGKVKTAVGPGHDEIHDMLILPNGKILVCGSSWDANKKNHIVLAQYNADGSLDNSFGTAGIYVGQLGEGIKILRLTDGKLLLAGREVGVTVPDAYVWKFSANGSLDNSFGINGLASVQEISLNAATLQSDGKILICGLKFGDFATARLLANGTLDTNFGTDGVVTTNVPSNQQLDQPHEVLTQADGKIVVVGESYTTSKHNMSLVRYFGGGGNATFEQENFGKFTVFPNPIVEGEMLTISVEKEFLGDLKIELIGLDGRIIKTISFAAKLSSPFNVLQAVSDLPTFFFVRVTDRESSAVRLVVKK